MKSKNIKCTRIFTKESDQRLAELWKISKRNSFESDLSTVISLSGDELKNITGGSGGGITPGPKQLWPGLQHALQQMQQ